MLYPIAVAYDSAYLFSYGEVRIGQCHPHQLVHPQHCIHGSSYFMRHGGKKVRLGLVRRIRPSLGISQSFVVFKEMTVFLISQYDLVVRKLFHKMILYYP